MYLMEVRDDWKDTWKKYLLEAKRDVCKVTGIDLTCHQDAVKFKNIFYVFGGGNDRLLS